MAKKPNKSAHMTKTKKTSASATRPASKPKPKSIKGSKPSSSIKSPPKVKSGATSNRSAKESSKSMSKSNASNKKNESIKKPAVSSTKPLSSKMPAASSTPVRSSGRLPKSIFSSDELREIRGALKRQLDGLLSHARENLIATNPEENSFNDEGDRADIAVNSEIALRIAEADAKDIAQIERAIARIDEGTYGICEVTGKPIERARLEFMPYATTCIEVARTMERRKPASDNNDNAIFSF